MNCFNELKKSIENCKYCEHRFGFVPHPVFWGNKNSKIVQISQAPSSGVHISLKPFTDLSGETLRAWYDLDEEEFYDKNNFYISALAHCYPGKNKNGGDNLPPKICFNKWVKKELELIDNKIYIIIGAKAAKQFFPNDTFEDLVFKDNIYNDKLTFVLPHPSPLNKKWLKDHPGFLEERLEYIRYKIKTLIG